jgi:hypothetical protein
MMREFAQMFIKVITEHSLQRLSGAFMQVFAASDQQ